jgi:hypothetical protein
MKLTAIRNFAVYRYLGTAGAFWNAFTIRRMMGEGRRQAWINAWADVVHSK